MDNLHMDNWEFTVWSIWLFKCMLADKIIPEEWVSVFKVAE
jgi:hypothetical protein